MRLPLVALPFAAGGIILAIFFVFGQTYTYYESTQQVLSDSTPGDPILRDRPIYSAETIEFLIHQKVNDYRVSNNLTALSYDPVIADVARLHSQDMAIRNYFAHDSPEGIGPDDRGMSAGYEACGDLEMRQRLLDFRINQDRNNADIRKLNQQINSINNDIVQYNKRVQDTRSDIRDVRPNQELLDRQEFQRLEQQYRTYDLESKRLERIADQLDTDYLEFERNLGRVYSGFSENIQSGYTYSAVIYEGERILGYEWYSQEGLAESIVQGWKDSPGHNENILRQYHNVEGIGVYITEDNQVLSTQNFC